MANHTAPQSLIKSADSILGTPAALSPEALAAQQAQGNAMRYILASGALATGVGALKGLYDSFRARKKVQDLKEDINYQPATLPLGKSASLGELLSGDYANRYGAMGVPWFLPGLLGAGLGGLYLGNKLTSRVGASNLQQDLAQEKLDEKKRYLQAVKGKQNVAEPLAKAASAPSYFSLQNWGPELGAGIGLVGAGALAKLLYGLRKPVAKKREEDNLETQKSFDQDLKAFGTGMPGRQVQPISFS